MTQRTFSISKRPLLIGGTAAFTLLIALVIIILFLKESSNTAPVNQPTVQKPRTTVTVGAITIKEATEATLKKQREEKERVTRLLQRARTNMKALRLTTPAQDNAYADYMAVLQIDPENKTAQKGIESIVTLYVDMVMQALQQYDFDKGKRYLNRAISISAEQTPLLELQQQVLQLEAHYLDTLKK